MKNAPTVLLCGFLAYCLLLGSALGQSNGTVKGSVKDPSGAILPGATVTLTNKATQRPQTTTTTEAGSYVFPAVPPGEYSLTFDIAGFRKLVRESVTLNVTETLVVDAILQVGEVTQEITVSEQASLVQTTTSALGRVVEQTLIANAPLSARNFTQMLGLSPGVASDAGNAAALGRGSGNISSNGARPWENSLVFNGMIADNVNSL